MQKQKNLWCIHQLSPCITTKLHSCACNQYPGLKGNNKRKRGYITTIKCEECSVMNKKIHMSVCK